VKLSIVTIAFNAAATIADTVQSVAKQRLPEGVTLEYIVIDGGSTDDTLKVIEPWRDRIDVLISERDKGLYDGMNKGVRAATGDFIGVLNSDDLYAHDQVLANVAAKLKESGADGLYGDLVYVDRHDTDKVTRKWTSGAYKQGAFLHGWMPPHPTFFARREAFEDHGGFNLALKSAADYELMLRFVHKHGLQLAYLPEVMVRMRVGGMSNASAANRLRANREDRAAWRMNGLKPLPWTLAMKPLRKVGQFLRR
jgi:glycosyltransferase involved in cell wall biosynthesis